MRVMVCLSQRILTLCPAWRAWFSGHSYACDGLSQLCVLGVAHSCTSVAMHRADAQGDRLTCILCSHAIGASSGVKLPKDVGSSRHCGFRRRLQQRHVCQSDPGKTHSDVLTTRLGSHLFTGVGRELLQPHAQAVPAAWLSGSQSQRRSTLKDSLVSMLKGHKPAAGSCVAGISWLQGFVRYT